MSEYATLMKVGTTSIVLDLIEDGILLKDVELRDPLEALKSISRDQSWKWIVRRKGGDTIKAVDLQRLYLAAAQEHYAGRDDQTDYVLGEWENVSRRPGERPLSAGRQARLGRQAQDDGRLHGGRKRRGKWGDDILHSLDLEYHNVNPETSLYYGLEQAGMIAARHHRPPHLRGDHDRPRQHPRPRPRHRHQQTAAKRLPRLRH